MAAGRTRSMKAVPRAPQRDAKRDELSSDMVGLETDRNALLKADVISARMAASAEPYQDEADRYWQGIGALEPPYHPWVLLTLLEHSNSLRQCIDAYSTNIDAHGHTFEPIIDIDGPEADARIKAYLQSRAEDKNPGTVNDPNHQLPDPTPEDIKACKAELAERMRAEKLKLDHFFEFACLDYSFVSLRRRTRQDLEGQGNAYWEVIRDEGGAITGFEYVPAFTMRHMPADQAPIEVTYKIKKNEFDYAQINTWKRFRRFVQFFESKVVWFKELGDPRVISRKTGMAFTSTQALKDHDKTDHAAAEIIHFRIHTAKTSYGVPRWIGSVLSILGSRHSEEVNLSYFENKSVPPLAILVSGGRMTNDTVTRIKDFLENDIKGKKNFHKVLVLEAESQGMSGFDQGRMKIDLKPLTSAQNNDALFQNYDERNIDKVGMAFRLPRMLRGDIRDFNRATADAALEFAEDQVFKPERGEFDFAINRRIFPLLGIRYWRFKSLGTRAMPLQDKAEIATKAGEVGFLTPAEGRDIMAEVFGKPLQKISADWAKQPFELTKAGIASTTDGQPTASGAGPGKDGALGGAAMAPATGGAPTSGAGVTPSLGGSDIGSIITVNEARQSSGMGALKLQDGSDDPDAFLTVAEFKAKRLAAAQAASGQPPSGAAAPQKSLDSPLLGFATQLLALRKVLPMLEAAEADAQYQQAKRDLAALGEPEEPA